MKKFSERFEENRKQTVEYNARCLENAFKQLIDEINNKLRKLFNSR